jgi:hypothetical protein
LTKWQSLVRIKRFVSIWRLSLHVRWALAASQQRCQQVVLDFLRTGGRLTANHVEYRGVTLPQRLFREHNLAAVGYLREFADFGGTIERAGNAFVATLPTGLRFEANNGLVIQTLAMLVERFGDEEYRWLEVAGRVVIDVGANVADSVIYFATRGAAYVYGYEPDDEAFAAAVRNVQINDIKNADVTHAAVIGAGEVETAGSISLASALKRARTERPELQIVCKIDCDGCEYNILENVGVSPELVRPVSQFMVEYHWRSPGPLCNVLEELGFEVVTTTPRHGVGWLRAKNLKGSP